MKIEKLTNEEYMYLQPHENIWAAALKKTYFGLAQPILKEVYKIFNRTHHRNITNTSCSTCRAEVYNGIAKLYFEEKELREAEQEVEAKNIYEKKCEALKKAREIKAQKKIKNG